MLIALTLSERARVMLSGRETKEAKAFQEYARQMKEAAAKLKSTTYVSISFLSSAMFIK
jgi:hypothetical protein